ncbi:WAT1-related protein At3g18200-like [Magnolia sinica]|uniref:WAT1-related protein At3g18200-like n=1 Tax=Magnolia sinica TaxID=86752 RepID=UPI002659E3E0|nr:WAT1-related protein At3g18200-like [Magnolia sinica]
MMASSLGRSATKVAPHVSMIFVQVISASYIVMSKVILVQGISSTVFLVYQFILATVCMAVPAFVFERNGPPLSKSVLGWIFLLALIGITLTQNLLAACLYYISSTVEAAVLNMIPAFTYIISISSREEKLEINTLWGKGKLFGTLLSVSGALSIMLWKGPAVHLTTTSSLLTTTSLGESVLGLVMLVVGVLGLSTWILLLRPVMKRYPAELSMTAIMFFFATLQTAAVAAITSRKASQWRLKWDLELLNIFFGAIFNSGLSNLLITWCASRKGPIFVASFPPLGLVFTTILEIVCLGDTLRISSVVGSIMIVVGLYIYLWSKVKEEATYLMIDGDDDDITTLLISNHSS